MAYFTDSLGREAVCTCVNTEAVRRLAFLKMNGFVAILSFYLLGTWMGEVGALTFNDEHRLLTKLFDPSNYDVDVYPRRNLSETLMVDFGIASTGLVGLDEQQEVLHLHSWLKMTWNDQRLTWDPSKYGDAQVIRINAQRLWKPDIELYNSVEDQTLVTGGNNVKVLAYSEGTALWILPRQLRAKCKLDMRRFPFDSHTCELRFGSWTFDGYKIGLSFFEGRESIDLSDFVDHNEWMVTENKAESKVTFYACCTEPYPTIVYTISFQRRSTLFSNICIGPAVVMALLIPLTFLMPPDSGAKVTLGGAIMICLILMVLTLENYLPATLSSLLAMYYASSFIMMGVSMAFFALSWYMWRLKSQPPAALSQVMIGCFGRILCVNPTQQANESGQVSAETGQADDVKMVAPTRAVNEWRVISIVLDRLLAIVFLVVVIIITITMLA